MEDKIKKQMHYTIGLDIGIASVGWAVINNDKNRIENLGVRTFKRAEASDGKSLNEERRTARGSRVRLRRRKIRMEKIKELFVRYQLISKEKLNQLYQLKSSDKSIWELRKIALDEKISPEEWARVLTSIAKRRGYQSNRKIEAKDEEVGKLTKGTTENKRILEEKKYRTIGEMFYEDEKFKNAKRNKSGEYNKTVLRKLLKEEIKILFETQRRLGNSYASKEFEKEYLEIFEYQKEFLTEKLLERMLGKCTFEKEEHRAPKNSCTFERFMLLQKVNNLRLIQNGTVIELTAEQKQKIVNLAYEQVEVKYGTIRNKLKIDKDIKFSGINYTISKKEVEKIKDNEDLIKKAESQRFIKLEGYHKIKAQFKKDDKEELWKNEIKDNVELQNIIADSLVRNKTDDKIKNYLKERNVKEEIAETVINLNFTKFGHLSYKAINKILVGLEKGLTYDKACEEAGYNFKAEVNKKYKKLPVITQIDETVRLNPVVLRAITQTRKLINAIIEEYGSPIAIHIETARELSKSIEERNRIEKLQKENMAQNEKIKSEIKENFGFEAKPFDIVKMKLWKEQKGMCAYSQKQIPANLLYEENFVQVDHIIPFSRCFDDSYNNKVLVLTDENQRKKERTPYEYFGNDEQRWNQFETFVKTTYINRNKKSNNLLMRNFSEEKSKEWIQRNINDTKYISRFLYNYISNYLEFAESDLKRKVYTINGQATATLRHYWGLKKDRQESDKHHAQDAVIIACASNKNIKRVSNYSRRKVLHINNEFVDYETGEIIDNKYNIDITIKEPWENFREEVEIRMSDNPAHSLKYGKFYNYDDIDVEKIKPIFISRMPERKIKGKAHKDTMRSMKFIKQGEDYTVVKKNLVNISRAEIEAIIGNPKFEKLYLSDKNTYDAIYEEMRRNEFKAEKAFANREFRKPSKKGNGSIVRSIKVPQSGDSGVVLKNNSIAENDNMVRVDVFEKNNKFYLVPIYVADFVKKQIPNKAIMAHKKENDWIEMDENYSFKFSLYPNDLIKIKKKGENEKFLYYQSTHRGTGAINTITVNGEEKIEGIGVKKLEKIEKYEVDMLGNISKIRQEKRKGVI